MYKVIAFAFAFAMFVVGASAQTTQTQSQEIKAQVTLDIPAPNLQAVPRTKQVTSNIPVSTKPRPKSNVRYVRRTSNVTTGYDIVGQPSQVTATVSIDATQIQSMITDANQPLAGKIEQLEINQGKIVALVNQNTADIKTLNTNQIALKQRVDVIQSDYVTQEQLDKAKKGIAVKSFLYGFGGGFLGGFLENLIFNRGGKSNNNGGGGNTCRGRWVNGQCVTGGGGNPCPIRGMRCNNGGGGPIRVCNGLPCQPGQGNQIGNTPETNQVETPLGSQVVINGSQSYNPTPVVYTNTAYVAPFVAGTSGSGPVRVRQ